MREASASTMAKEFPGFHDQGEDGATVLIRKDSRAVARRVPDCEFITGRKAADVFRSHKAAVQDKATANAIAAEIRKLGADRVTFDQKHHGGGGKCRSLRWQS